MNAPLLSRDEFRRQVFAASKGRCVLCEKEAVDAHHILDRKLWPDGGYYLANGAAVCAEHHLLCEQTRISVEEVRAAAGITQVLLPPQLEEGVAYDKWGNVLMPSGQRLRGEMFFEESVQKVLAQAGLLGEFSPWVKYPRTFHLPWSPGATSDDRMLPSLSGLEGEEVVVTEKMDGENTTLYRDHMHARSVDSLHHPSRDWVKGMWGSVRWDIPENWRVCGENLYARHSLGYEKLPSFFQAFSVWNERNVCLGWDETQEWLQLLGLRSVPVLYRGKFDAKEIRRLCEGLDLKRQEGCVVRVSGPIAYGEFRHKVGKFVRAGHVQTDQHWAHGQWQRNEMAKEEQ